MKGNYILSQLRIDMKYTEEKAGEWIQPIRKNYKMRCCDCGLVHRMDFRLLKNGRGNFIQFRAFRDDRATGQSRRHIESKKLSNRKGIKV